MKVYLGEKGLSKSWQDDFPKTVKCHKCKENCRPMFTVFEEKEKEYVSNLHGNLGKGNYWPHDAIACTVYLCNNCFEPNALINQA